MLIATGNELAIKTIVSPTILKKPSKKTKSTKYQGKKLQFFACFIKLVILMPTPEKKLKTEL